LPDDEENHVEHAFHLEGSTVVFDKPPSTKETARETREREAHEFARNQVQINKRTGWFNGLLVLATFSSVGIGLWQGSISQTAANAARDAVGIAEHTREDAKTSSDASTKQANNVLQATMDNFQREQRPWVVATVLQLILDEKGGSNMTVNTWITNKGKTPAFDVKVSHFGSITSYVPLDIDVFLKTTKSKAYSGISNNGFMVQGYEANVPQITTALTPKQSADIKAKKLLVYTFGDINYTDSFGVHHFTQFCGIYEPTNFQMNGVTQFNFCKRHNFVDRNK